MASAAILYYEPRKPVSEFEGESLEDGEESASSDESVRRAETESRNGNNRQGASQSLSLSKSTELNLMVNEVVDKLGPLSDEEIKQVREWLELGS